MPKFTERTALKEVVKFAKREFREKKPYTAKVLRVKDEKIFSKGGPLPVIAIKQTQIPYYIVLLDYRATLRAYNFSKDGTLLFGENIEKESDKLIQIEKTTKIEFIIPRK
ncbi:MAG: hypothetical protein ACFFBE_03050 [Promethearchaeota archaeon]